ncbi:MAG: methionyl-tRNA formyltransferase [Chloroflexi bacterium]|nr:MAG: methionyl-tRNA formyltransferase [Chloroflexota bacterium]
MRIIFFGSPREAADSLRSLISAGHDVVAVYTRPDRRAGRGREKSQTPVKVFAEKQGLPVFTPAGFRNSAQELDRMADANADVFVVVAYGRILPADILKVPPMGVVNVHPSLLPMYRGPSPVVMAILDGQTHTGVSVMLLDEGMDTGPVLAQSPPVRLTGRERAAELQARLFKEGAAMLPAVLTGLQDGTVVPTPQDDSKATVTRLLDRSDGEIDWSLSAAQIDRMVRAYDPWPGTFTSWNGKGLKILDVELLSGAGIGATTESRPDLDSNYRLGHDPGKVVVRGGKLLIGTGTGPLEITRLQLEGRQGVAADEFLRGRPDIGGATLGGQS